MDDAELGDLDYCYVTTTGRRSGRPHTIEIWFATEGNSVYLLAEGGERSDWVRNIMVNPTVGLRVGDRDMIAQVKLIRDEPTGALVRRLLMEKYRPRYEGDLTEWNETALPVEIRFPGAPPDVPG